MDSAYIDRLMDCEEAGVYYRVTPTGLIVVEYDATKRKKEDFKEGDLVVVRRIDFILEAKVYKRTSESPKTKYRNWMGKIIEPNIANDLWNNTEKHSYPECKVSFIDKVKHRFFHCELSLADKKERFLYEMSGSDVMGRQDDD